MKTRSNILKKLLVIVGCMLTAVAFNASTTVRDSRYSLQK